MSDYVPRFRQVNRHNPSTQGGYADTYYSLWSFPKDTDGVIKFSDCPIYYPNPYYPTGTYSWLAYHTPLWPIIIIGLVVFLIWTEYGSQDCRQQSCNNQARVIYPEDDDLEAIDKISYNVLKNHTVIGWRRALLAAIFISLIVLFIFCPDFPDGFTVFVTITLIFFLVYFSSAWFQAHWWKFNDYKIDESLKELRQRLSKI